MARPRRTSGETHYIRAADMPPLHPDDHLACIKRLTTLYDKINMQADLERRAKLLSWAHLAP